MSNDHQPLSGNLNHVHWSEDDIANVIAVLKSGEAFREVPAQSDAYVFLLHSKHVLKLTVFDRFSVDTEDPLPMSNEHEPVSGGSDVVQLSDQEIADLVAAIEDDETPYEPCAESNSYVLLLHSKHVLKLTVFDRFSVDTEDALPMSNEHEPLSCDSDVVQLSEQMSEQEIANLVAAIEDFEASYEPCAESNSYVLLIHSKHVIKLTVLDRFHNDTEDSLRNINDTLLAGPANAHVNR
jgi:hypothetical protein